MEEVDVESLEAKLVLNKLGYTVKDILDNNYEVPEVFVSCKKEHRQMYLN